MTTIPRRSLRVGDMILPNDANSCWSQGLVTRVYLRPDDHGMLRRIMHLLNITGRVVKLDIHNERTWPTGYRAMGRDGEVFEIRMDKSHLITMERT